MISLEENQDVSSDGAKPTKVGGEVNYPEWQRKGHAYKNIQHQEGVVVWPLTVYCIVSILCIHYCPCDFVMFSYRVCALWNYNFTKEP